MLNIYEELRILVPYTKPQVVKLEMLDRNYPLPGESDTKIESDDKNSNNSNKGKIRSYDGATVHYHSDSDWSVTVASSTSN